MLIFNSFLTKDNFHECSKLLNLFNLDMTFINDEIPNFVEFYDQHEISKSLNKKQSKNFEKYLSQQVSTKGQKGKF